MSLSPIRMNAHSGVRLKLNMTFNQHRTMFVYAGLARNLALALLAAAFFSGCATTKRRQPLDERIDRIVAKAPHATIAVAWYDLETGASFFRREHDLIHAASTMKVPVMLALFREVEAKVLRLDQPVRIHNEFRSIADGSPYSLDPKDDSDPELYKLIRSERPLGELIRRMIVRSSNLATNLVIDLVGPARVGELMNELGAEKIRIRRGVEDEKAFEAGMNNMVTAHDLMLVMRAIAEERAVSTEASVAMLEILKQQEHSDNIPTGLPRGTVIANKTGNITEIAHDAAIVFPPGRKPFVLVVLTKGFKKPKDASRVIASIARAVWDQTLASEKRSR